MLLKKDFYNRSALLVAKQLLGCYLIRKSGSEIFKMMIVETEAYEGQNDLASHASRGRTPRNSIMFGEPGLIYVYFTYGMHYMLNIVTGPKDYPAAVLLRAVEYLPSAKSEIKSINASGPARLTKALAIDKTFNGQPIYTKKHGLWIEAGAKLPSKQIISAKRVGVDYAKEYKDKFWRFYIKDNKSVSRK